MEEIALDDLGVDAVAEYLERRFAGSRFPPEVARLLRERTDGNPLFLVTLVDHLLARGAIVERDGHWDVAKGLRGELAAVPESLRRLIEQQLDRLDAEDRELLEAASLVGIEFSAAGGGRRSRIDGTAEAEERCAIAGPRRSVPAPRGKRRMARRHGRRVLRLPPPALSRGARRGGARAPKSRHVHLRIGRALEAAYGERSSELAAELALHFEEGGDRARALRYRRLAAETAARRYAFAEAETHLERALALLGGLPATPERDREEFSLQSALGAVRMATAGLRGAGGGERLYAGAGALGRDAAGAVGLSGARGIWTFYTVTVPSSIALSSSPSATGRLPRRAEIASCASRLTTRSG